MNETTLGQRLSARRKEQGWTLTHLASLSGSSVSHLSDLEHDRSFPSLQTLQRIAETFGTDARGLLEGVNPFGAGKT